MQHLLELKNLQVAYGGIQAVKGVELTINQGELIALIGSNGAGKTTTMKAVTGGLPKAGGTITYQGVNLDQVKPWDLVRNGLVMVPEGRGIFTRMSIVENMRMGAYARSDKKQIECDIEKNFTLFPKLKERAKQLAGTLSGGEQQMLAMSRALMSQPQLLLLDEPTMGLSPVMVDKIFEVIIEIRKKGTTILLVEQNVHRSLQIADRAYVMDSGLITISGAAADLLQNPQIHEAYLGA